MPHLRVWYQAALTVILASLALSQVSHAQSQQSASSPPASNAQNPPTKGQPSTDPFSVVTPNGTWTNQTGMPAVPGSPLPISFPNFFGNVYEYFLPEFVGKSLGGVFIGIFDAQSAGCEYAGAPGSCVTVVNPDGSVVYAGDAGAPIICPQCPPYQEPGSGPIPLNVPMLIDNSGPVDSGTPNSSSGIAINSQLVSDSPPPANGITIQTQFALNPSNDSTVVEAPSAPISIESNLVSNSPSTAASPPEPWQPGSAERPKQSFWDKFADGVQIAGEIAQGVEQARELARAGTSAPTSKASGNSAVCAAGYVFNTGKQAAVQQIAKLDAQGKIAEGTMLERNFSDGSYTAWCVPANAKLDQWGRQLR